MKIFKIKDSRELEDYELAPVEKLNVDWFVYYYEYGDYEGNGFAVWKKDGKYFYGDLGHCSCYGPTENLSSIPYDRLEDIAKFADNYNKGQEVINLIREKINEGSIN